MKTAIQFLCPVMVLAVLLSGCRANTAKNTVTEATTVPTTEATTAPTTEPTTLPTIPETTFPTEQETAIPDARSGLADENGTLPSSNNATK